MGKPEKKEIRPIDYAWGESVEERIDRRGIERYNKAISDYEEFLPGEEELLEIIEEVYKVRFRAWNESEKHMHYQDDWSSVEGFWASAQYHKLMQYTGLSDKNGKEIYEGDILNIDCDCIPEKGCCGHPEKVVFAGGMFQVSEEWLVEHSDYSEIIGNTYENPELLKDGK